MTAAWFVAYTKQISTAVMFVAGDSGNEDLNRYAREGASSFYGGGYPAQTWVDYMATAMKGMPDESFADPDWVNLSGKHYGETKRPEVPVEEDSRDTSDNSDSNDPESPVESSAPVPTASKAPSSKPSPTASQEPPKPSSTMTRTEPTHTRRPPHIPRPTHTARPTHTSHPTSGETTRGGLQPGGPGHNG